jgi:hypothetical protein
MNKGDELIVIAEDDDSYEFVMSCILVLSYDRKMIRARAVSYRIRPFLLSLIVHLSDTDLACSTQKMKTPRWSGFGFGFGFGLLYEPTLFAFLVFIYI